MFCTNCGKEIIDTARFCNYCGRPVQNLMPPPPYISQNTGAQNMGQPYSSAIPMSGAPVPEQNNTVIMPENVQPENMDNTASDAFPEAPEAYAPEADSAGCNTAEPEISEAAPETESMSQQTAGGTFSAEANPYPTPGNIPKSGGFISGTYSMPMPDTAMNIVSEPVSSAPTTPGRERRYTLGHILLCLASTAIMAITAGVFAGLYFSVV